MALLFFLRPTQSVLHTYYFALQYRGFHSFRATGTIWLSCLTSHLSQTIKFDVGSSHKSQTLKWGGDDITDLKRPVLHLHYHLFQTPPHVQRSTQMISIRKWRTSSSQLTKPWEKFFAFNLPGETSTLKKIQTILTSELWCTHPVTVSSTVSLSCMKKNWKEEEKHLETYLAQCTWRGANPPECCRLPAESWL